MVYWSNTRPETVKLGCWGGYHKKIAIRHFFWDTLYSITQYSIYSIYSQTRRDQPQKCLLLNRQKWGWHAKVEKREKAQKWKTIGKFLTLQLCDGTWKCWDGKYLRLPRRVNFFSNRKWKYGRLGGASNHKFRKLKYLPVFTAGEDERGDPGIIIIIFISSVIVIIICMPPLPMIIKLNLL